MNGLGRIAGTVACLVALVAMHRSAAATGPPGDPLESAAPVVIGHRVVLHSEVLDEDRVLFIAAPEGSIAPGHSLPVVIVLDGRFNFNHTAASVDLLTRQGLMPPSLVVAVANTVRERDFTAVRSNAPATGGADRFLDFVELEVVPFLESSFDAAPHRTVIGHSLGALLAVHAIVERPGLFRAAIAISPALTNDERVPDGATPISARLRAALGSRSRQPMALFVTISDGEDRQWLEDLAAAVKVLEAGVPEGFAWRLERMAGEDHSSTVHRSTYDGLRWIHRDWNADGLVGTGDLEAVDKRFDAISSRLGFEVPPPEAVLNAIGYRLLAEGRDKEAVAVFERAVELYPASANAHDSLGEGLERAGRLPGALRCYRRAVTLAEAGGDRDPEVYRANLERLEQRLFGGARREHPENLMSTGGRLAVDPDGGG
ncbi:MAG TPA: alpha/beta hydrolase-fold protein [Candidatus Sulfomarinibacteraceae bacterium]|nr:alpha/beta hydrolase-fold protein [Candidatus Sulfomarinibacteraceae bacterium]